jgi:hypothetical protein
MPHASLPVPLRLVCLPAHADYTTAGAYAVAASDAIATACAEGYLSAYLAYYTNCKALALEFKVSAVATAFAKADAYAAVQVATYGKGYSVAETSMYNKGFVESATYVAVDLLTFVKANCDCYTYYSAGYHRML